MQKGLLLGFQTYLKFSWNKWVLNFYSIASLKFLEKLSALVFYVPGVCAADTHIFCDAHHTHSYFAISLRNSFWEELI